MGGRTKSSFLSLQLALSHSAAPLPRTICHFSAVFCSSDLPMMFSKTAQKAKAMATIPKTIATGCPHETPCFALLLATYMIIPEMTAPAIIAYNNMFFLLFGWFDCFPREDESHLFACAITNVHWQGSIVLHNAQANGFNIPVIT